LKSTLLVGLLCGPLAAAFSLLAPATAASGSCTSSQVTVVVQFPDHTTVGCASGNPSTGYDALKAAGFAITYATGSGSGALCSINTVPHPVCNGMPAANAYWAYFHAKPGGAWNYSDTGGGSYNPAPGSVEGWRFGSGSAPSGSAPTLVVPVKTPTKTATKPTKAPTKAATKKPTTHATTAPVAPGASTSPTTSPTAGPTTSVQPVETSAPASATATSSAPGIPDRAAGMDEKSTPTASSAHGGLSWIWGVVLVVVLLVAGGATALARRRG
jgi:hypothetical protein